MTIKLKCLAAKRKAGDFNVDSVYPVTSFNQNSDKTAGTISIINRKGKKTIAAFHFAKNKEMIAGGCMFRLLLVPLTEKQGDYENGNMGE